MAPSFMIDNDSDFNLVVSATKTSSFNARTLLLAPPSISSHEESLRNVLASHDRSVTDLQMLDRLSAGLVTLPDSTYDLILILTDADGTRVESTQLLGRDVFARIVSALKAGGKLQAQDGTFAKDVGGVELREAILAGLVAEGDAMVKPDYSASEAVPLRMLRRKDKGAVSNAGPAVASATVPVNGKRKSVDMTGAEVKPAGVGFVDFIDDFGEPMITGEDDDDDELIDEDTLLTEEELKRPATIPAECIPRVGKRRRACKDCTCGLAQKLEAEDAAKRAGADAQLKTLNLGADDLAEVDFTVQGKVGSCGNCSLGDAFRCDGCPYIGMPAFKPGEEVRLLNNDVQL
ncbi:probable Fe-S cluster assembly protein dre2 [Phialocephala subalpina]|uniref:Probable Fe-S cluster assembly protein dre2 n=1 Tax=Phialocephala subalpina TaxID=576137 RepID=A0A1L7X5Y4_9HELO|nr:probable Fe-S cluster assembly protein dre2 [Phialocephala subalpina]